MDLKHLNVVPRKLLFWAAMLATYAALSCGVGSAAEPVSLVFDGENGHYSLEGCFSVQADPDVAWKVLTDYDHIPDFVGNMKVSHIQEHWDNDLLLRQEAEGGFLFFTQRVRLLLWVHERPGHSIVFQDTSHQDFDFYQGSWSIQKDPVTQELQVTYRLDANQKFSAPAFLADDAVHGGAQDLLKAVRQRILSEQEKKAPRRRH